VLETDDFTITGTLPAVCFVVVQVMLVFVKDVILQIEPPIVTIGDAKRGENEAPVIVILVPPLSSPNDGETVLIIGLILLILTA
jgi:hypothetical protein